MRCSLKLLVPLMVLAPVAVMAAQRAYPNVGKPLTQAEIQAFDHMIGPDGKELPVGHGSPKEGAEIFAKRCEVCHGKNGENGITHHLVAGQPGKPFRGPFYGPEKDGPSYFPYPTIAWDYINRAMPASNPGSLKTNEVYALVAFLYYRNGIIKETDVMDEKTLPKVEMPNKNGFIPAKPVYPQDPKWPSWY